MTPAPTPPPPPSSNEWSIKAFVAACALVSTAAGAIVNGCVNKHYVGQAADEATQKSDVRRLEDLITSGDSLTKILVTEIRAGEVTAGAKKAISENLMQQERLLGELNPLATTPAQTAAVESYQAQIVKINKALREVDSMATAIVYGQAVAEGVDRRMLAVRELRRAAGLPVRQPHPNALQPDNSFGTSDT